MKEHIITTIDSIQIGDAIQFKNLSIIPLFSNQNSQLNHISLKTGLDKGLVEVTEISEGGSVPNLRVTNNADVPLFILDGEEVVGAKQNRIVNTSLLLAAKSSFDIPVSCTERGRWSYNSKKFKDSGVVMSSKARYSKSTRIQANLMRKRGYNAEQAKVWNDIEVLHNANGSSSSSSTRAMKDAFDHKVNEMEDYLKALPLQEGQNGMMVFENGKLIGGDFLSSPTVYADLHDKLIKSFAIETMYKKEAAIKANPVDLQLETKGNLSLLKEAQSTVHEPVGLGKDIRLESDKTKAAALQHQEEVVHLSVFSKEDINDDDIKDNPSDQPTRPTTINRNSLRGRLSGIRNIPNLINRLNKITNK